jgi:pyruvate formate lyase activating enzyme
VNAAPGTARPPAPAAGPSWIPAVLASPARQGRIRCDLCPFQCVLGDGQTGACRVRRNRAGTLETATFTAAVAHLDAIERKPFYHLRPGSMVLTVAGPGCTFRCDYCINHRLSQYGREDTAPWTGGPAQPRVLVGQARAAGAAIGLSYAEPGLAPELTLALAEHAVPAGVPVVWKSNGFLTEQAIDLVAPVLTAVNIDVKAAGDAAHRKLTGAPLGPVLRAIERFRALGVWVEISTPLIPGASAEIAEQRVIAATLAAIDRGMPWHLLRFTPDFRMRDQAPTAPAALRAAREAGRAAGLEYVYVERALGPGGRRTQCPACAAALVERGIWETLQNEITAGRCPRCQHKIPGRWESQP